MVALVVHERGGAQARFDLDLGETILGRDDESDIVLAAPNISGRHLAFHRTATGVELHDLESTNGTYVNGRRLSAPRAAAAGDRIYVGDYVLWLEAAVGSLAPATPPAVTERPGVVGGHDDGMLMTSADPPKRPTRRRRLRVVQLEDGGAGGGDDALVETLLADDGWRRISLVGGAPARIDGNTGTRTLGADRVRAILDRLRTAWGLGTPPAHGIEEGWHPAGVDLRAVDIAGRVPCIYLRRWDRAARAHLEQAAETLARVVSACGEGRAMVLALAGDAPGSRLMHEVLARTGSEKLAVCISDTGQLGGGLPGVLPAARIVACAASTPAPAVAQALQVEAGQGMFVHRWWRDASETALIRSTLSRRGGPVVISGDGDPAHPVADTLKTALGAELFASAVAALVHVTDEAGGGVGLEFQWLHADVEAAVTNEAQP